MANIKTNKALFTDPIFSEGFAFNDINISGGTDYIGSCQEKIAQNIGKCSRMKKMFKTMYFFMLILDTF